MPKGITSFYSFRGDSCKYKQDAPFNEFTHMYVNKFYVEPASSKDEFFYVKYLNPIDGAENTYFFVKFNADYPIEEIIETLNNSATLGNVAARHFSFEVTGSPSWQYPIKLTVNNPGTTVTFYTTTQIAYKMGLEPGKIYSTTTNVTGEYKTVTKETIYYDLKVGSQTIARYHTGHSAEENVQYPVFIKAEPIQTSQISIVCNDRVTHHDVASTFEFVYLNDSANFRIARFTERAQDLITPQDTTEAGLRNISVFDRDHYINENDTFITMVRYEPLLDGTTYELTNNFELALTGNPNIIDYPNKDATDKYILISAKQTINGAFVEMTNCIWLPVDIHEKVIPVPGYEKFVQNFLYYNKTNKPKRYQYYTAAGVSQFTIDQPDPILVEVKTLPVGYTNDSILVAIGSFTSMGIQRNDLTNVLSIYNSNAFMLFGPRAVQHYLYPLPCIVDRENVYNDLATTTDFSVINSTYSDVQVNYRTPQTIYYRINIFGRSYYVNAKDQIYNILWYKELKNILIPRDFTVTAHSLNGDRLYETDDFSIEVLFR